MDCTNGTCRLRWTVLYKSLLLMISYHHVLSSSEPEHTSSNTAVNVTCVSVVCAAVCQPPSYDPAPSRSNYTTCEKCCPDVWMNFKDRLVPQAFDNRGRSIRGGAAAGLTILVLGLYFKLAFPCLQRKLTSAYAEAVNIRSQLIINNA